MRRLPTTMIDSLRSLVTGAIGAGTLVAGAGLATADTGADVYKAMGLAADRVLTGTVLTATVVPGSVKQVVTVVTYLTGKQEKGDAVNVRLEVFQRRDDRLVSSYRRDFGAERGGFVGGGDLELVDLDRDGVNEIIVSFDTFDDPLVEQRLAEVLLFEESTFRTGWAGAIEYDATRDARNVPPERRDRYTREIDIPSTLRARGRTLYVDKEIVAVAGERLAQPRIVEETFPLRAMERER